MVLHRPQTLVPSSGSTTPPDQMASPARSAWCLTARKPLFLRPEAPRPQPKQLRRRGRRGASPPANPCSFVRKHHAPGPNSSADGAGVVPHRPQTLVPSSGSTTPPDQMAPPAPPAGGAHSDFMPKGRAEPYSFLLPQDRAGPRRGSSADAVGTIHGNEIGLWMTADTFCQLSQSP